MIALSFALVIVALIAGYLVNKFLDKRYPVNTVSAIDADTIAALEERIHKFDERINATWGTISTIKQEQEAYKLAMGLKGRQ